MSRRDREELLGGNNIIDEVDDIEFGERRSRRNTSIQYRDSSSLTPLQFMERDVYYHYAIMSLLRAIDVATIASILSVIYNNYKRIVSYWDRISNGLNSSISAVRAKMNNIKNQLERLLLLISWIRSHGEIALLYAEDLTVYIRRRNRFHPKRFRRINEISRDNCYNWFGMSPHDLRVLFTHLRIPETFRGTYRHIYNGEECFIIFLHHMIKGAPFTEMARHTFGGDPRPFSKMCDLMIDHLYITFYNKISGTSLEQWIPRYLNTCRLLIHDALGDGAIFEEQYVDGEVVNQQLIRHYFDFDTFRPFGFLDDFAQPTARPGIAPTRLHNYAHDIQRAFYSGYLRSHGLKAQVVYLPIGIIGSVFVTEIRQNDNGVQNMSGLNNYLVRILAGILIGGLLPALYCDGIFAILVCILPRFSNPTPARHLINMRLASLRECIEHVFADHRIRFKLFGAPHTLRLFNQGVKIRRMFLVSFFLQNCYYCLQGTRCRYFGHIPPTLEEYIPLNEVLQPPPAVDLGDVWEYGAPRV